jgi:hypothetical protein
MENSPEKMEANPGELKCAAMKQEVPREVAMGMIGALKDRPGD